MLRKNGFMFITLIILMVNLVSGVNAQSVEDQIKQVLATIKIGFTAKNSDIIIACFSSNYRENVKGELDFIKNNIVEVVTSADTIILDFANLKIDQYGDTVSLEADSIGTFLLKEGNNRLDINTREKFLLWKEGGGWKIYKHDVISSSTNNSL